VNYERAALHEAGHAVTAVILGLEFAQIRLSPPELVWGKEAFGKDVSHPTSEALALAVTTLAGAAALELITGERHSCSDCSDLRQAREMLSQVRDAPSVEATYAVAFSMLYRARVALTAVAIQLLVRGELPHSQVLTLVDCQLSSSAYG